MLTKNSIYHFQLYNRITAFKYKYTVVVLFFIFWSFFSRHRTKESIFGHLNILNVHWNTLEWRWPIHDACTKISTLHDQMWCITNQWFLPVCLQLTLGFIYSLPIFAILYFFEISLITIRREWVSEKKNNGEMSSYL